MLRQRFTAFTRFLSRKDAALREVRSLNDSDGKLNPDMPQSNTWIVGADPNCDIVIDVPSVSGRHCRLICDGDLFSIEDLQSTNGTYVNGTRCNGTQPITRQDRITLGQTVSLPWRKIVKIKGTSACRTITIGRTPDNDIVLDYSMVSSHHAEITIDGDRASIRDLGTTNGTSIGSIENKVQVSPLSAHDTVFFGTLPFKASQLMDLSGDHHPIGTTVVVSPSSGTSPDVFAAGSVVSASGRRSRWILPVIIGGPAVLIVIASLVAILSGRQSPTPAEHPPTPSTPEVSDKPKSIAKSMDSSHALYLVLVKDAQQAYTFRVGTAAAISDHQLLTTASVVKAIESLQNEFPVVTVLCPATGKQLFVLIRKWRIHPEFLPAYRASQAASQRYDELMERIKSIAEQIKRLEKTKAPSGAKALSPSRKQRIDELRTMIATIGRQLKKADSRILLNSERVACFDLGVLEVDGELPEPLSITVIDESYQSGDLATLQGVPYPVGEQLLPAFKGVQSRNVDGHIRMLKRFNPKLPEPYRLVIKSSADLSSSQWTGSPILNRRGRIIGVFSRLTPSYTDKPPAGDLYDAPLAVRLHDFAVANNIHSGSTKE